MRTGTDTHLPGDLLIESSIDAMIAIGTDGIVIAWNNAATTLFDQARNKAIGNPLFDVLPSLKDDAVLRTAIQWAMKGKKNFLAASPDFIHRRHVETHVIPLHQAEAIVGIMLLIHDVSHRIAKESELQKLNEELKDRLRQLHLTGRELSQLTHITGHNIRGPIREIYTTVEGLLRTEAGVMSHSGRASFRRIQSSLNRMNLLLDDIITLTQINITERPDSIINMVELVQELKIQFSKKFHDSKTVLTIGTLCDIRAHYNQVLLLLQHIFSNIIKFAASESMYIHINCEKIHYTEKNNDNLRTGEYYLLSITHNSSAFDSTNPGTTLQVVDNTNVHNYTGPAIAMVIAAKIMEVHSGFLMIEKTDKGDNKINCFFPVNDPGSIGQTIT